MDEFDPPSLLKVPKQRTTKHYYGDYVRRLFLVAGIIMLIGLPFLKDAIHLPVFFSTFAILVVTFLAGFTNPQQKWVMYMNCITSLFALIVFEYFAVVSYSASSVSGVFFVINQLLAIVFFFALYYSSKSLRGMYLR